MASASVLPRRPPPGWLSGQKQTEITRQIGIAAIAIFPSVTAEVISNPGLSSPAALGLPWDVVQVDARPSSGRPRIV